MANEQNFVRPTPEQAKEWGAIGGVKSGKVRREKRALKETLETLLSMPMKNGKAADIEKIRSIAELKGKNITAQEAIALAQIVKAVKGDTRAAEFVRDASGNKIAEETNVNMNLPVVFSGEDDLAE